MFFFLKKKKKRRKNEKKYCYTCVGLMVKLPFTQGPFVVPLQVCRVQAHVYLDKAGTHIEPQRCLLAILYCGWFSGWSNLIITWLLGWTAIVTTLTLHSLCPAYCFIWLLHAPSPCDGLLSRGIVLQQSLVGMPPTQIVVRLAENIHEAVYHHSWVWPRIVPSASCRHPLSHDISQFVLAAMCIELTHLSSHVDNLSDHVLLQNSDCCKTVIVWNVQVQTHAMGCCWKILPDGWYLN